MNSQAFTKTYDGRMVLDFPTMTLVPGTIYAVIGANGCGKSTLAKVLSGTIQSDQRKKVLATASVGYMPQNNFAFRMTTKANLLLNGKDEDKAQRLMQALHIDHLADQPAHRLSGGETARMALARLMMKEYEVVILDEPTAAMDIETTLLSEKMIQRYVQDNRCVLILITHSLQQARRLADYIWYIHQGALLEHGARDNLLQTPTTSELKTFLDFYGV